MYFETLDIFYSMHFNIKHANKYIKDDLCFEELKPIIGERAGESENERERKRERRGERKRIQP